MPLVSAFLFSSSFSLAACFLRSSTTLCMLTVLRRVLFFVSGIVQSFIMSSIGVMKNVYGVISLMPAATAPTRRPLT